MQFPTNPTVGTEVTAPNGTSYIYTADGAWRKTASTVPVKATQSEVDEGLNDDKFVTPNTLRNYAGSEEVPGVLQIATGAEVQAGVIDTKAVSPAGLSARTATETRTGLIELATVAEAVAGADTQRAVTPAGLTARTATDARTGLIEIATSAEVNAGSDAERAVTPATLAGRGATTTMTGLIELATNAETAAGSDTVRAVTPAALAAFTNLLTENAGVTPSQDFIAYWDASAGAMRKVGIDDLLAQISAVGVGAPYSGMAPTGGGVNFTIPRMGLLFTSHDPGDTPNIVYGGVMGSVSIGSGQTLRFLSGSGNLNITSVGGSTSYNLLTW